MGYKLPVLSLLGLSLLLLVLQTTGSQVGSERCLLDDDQTTVELETCLEKGEEFIERLLEHIRGNARRRQHYDVCQSFSHFKKCIEPLFHTCAEVRHKLQNNWKLIYDVVNCACNGTASCKNSMDCFVEQFKSRLGRQCDAVYRFNAKQGTNDRCHFLYENIRCKEALVESACSPEAGVFAFHVAKVANRIHIRKHRCVITRNREYHGFKYTAQCPANLTTVMDDCERAHIGQNNKVKFRRDFDLITKGGKKELRRSCKDYEDYETCIRPLKSTCSHGINKVYEFDGELRRYLLKMEYICNEGKQGYMTHLRCYRDLLDNDTLAQCNYIWDKLSPMLQNLNAHGFYCLPNSSSTRLVQETLVNIRKCYEDVFDKSCGAGGDIIGDLMTKVFKDPVYLRYRFRPDCALHAAEPFATSGPPAPTRAPRPGTRKPRPPKYHTKRPPKPSSQNVHSGTEHAQLSSVFTSTLSLTLTMYIWRHWRS